ncbi:hypothetical protein GCM10018962_81330 [Dactylosporangium matsuzakiense]|uniref:Uncharacterized protein n=1 Tax=Dactylosporangium matsuzakiense TaxID=53360 RepID=A0A9W6KFY8_9ACTN|nr:hypothetical protein GCM10017581_031220 [Dactylosporangium matsuzakiense]
MCGRVASGGSDAVRGRVASGGRGALPGRVVLADHGAPGWQRRPKLAAVPRPAAARRAGSGAPGWRRCSGWQRRTGLAAVLRAAAVLCPATGRQCCGEGAAPAGSCVATAWVEGGGPALRLCGAGDCTAAGNGTTATASMERG